MGLFPISITLDVKKDPDELATSNPSPLHV